MKQVTKDMIDDFKIMKKKIDFMGYQVDSKNGLSFHHLIVPKRNCKKEGLGDGYLYWNGAILVQDTSHNYLHLIERLDPEIFSLISSEMIDENIKRKIEKENLLKIRDLLLYFEREHDHDYNGNKLIIKREYVNKRVNINDIR